MILPSIVLKKDINANNNNNNKAMSISLKWHEENQMKVNTINILSSFLSTTNHYTFVK